MVPHLEDLPFDIKLKEMHLTTLIERKEETITIYKLMNNVEETDRKKPSNEKKKRGETFRGKKKL